MAMIVLFSSFRKFAFACAILLSTIFGFSPIAQAGDYNSPWRDKSKGIVIDAYDKNDIDWTRMVKDKRIVGFIGKASDGMSPPYGCSSHKNTTSYKLCRKTWDNYALKQKLFKSRRVIAKSLGLKWGSYHLGRRGNPVAQAYHYLQFADPKPDDFIALDIEHGTGDKWISLADAEIFVDYIKKRLGRYPVLYTNHSTAQTIAANRDKYPILSRLKLWYPRYRSEIKGAFPLGNWDSYELWQFSSNLNCRKKSCFYRPPGTPLDIDVNISKLSVAALRKAWPFEGIWPQKITPKALPDIVVAKTIDLSTHTAVAVTPIEEDEMVCKLDKAGVEECETR